VDDEALIREQIYFYREGTPYYGHVVGPADEAFNDRVLAYCPASRHCLELASGSGRWTMPLLGKCERITAVDSSPERHALSDARIADPRVEYIEADLFQFRPPAKYDLVFAGFWLSHVPPARFQSFWAMIADALAPNGRVVMVDDGTRDPRGVVRFENGPDGSGAERHLPNGKAFSIVKVAYAPDELEALLGDLGWTATVTLLTPTTYVLQANRGADLCVDYVGDLASVYEKGRELPDAVLRLWTDRIAQHLGRGDLVALDLGAGTGRFSAALAGDLGCRVIGVEPSDDMRAVAAAEHPHPDVVFRKGSAESLPVPPESCNFAFLSCVIHYVELDTCARELRRALRPDGLVFIRSAFSGRLEALDWLGYFPAARAIDEHRMPTVEQVVSAFAAHGFAQVALEEVEQETAPSLRALHERLQLRAISTLRLITDEEFEAGLAQLRDAAENEEDPAPVHSTLDLLVLRLVLRRS
jgi:ubiquinone/menaquinone biosynthesis C-methylase UbiE